MQIHSSSKPRRPLLALLLSAILPGLGQLYNGEWRKTIWLLLGFGLLSVLGIVVIGLYLPISWTLPALIVGVFSLLILWLYSMTNAFRSARRQRDYTLKSWQSAGVYGLVWVMCSLIALPMLSDYVQQHRIEAFLVPSNSMNPTVLKYDLLFADKRYNRIGATHAVQRGDIAIFIYPDSRNTYFIKRIIGLPGDKVKIKGADVSINGKPLRQQTTTGAHGLLVTETSGEHSWQVFWNNQQAQLPQTDLTVPHGEVFVMGDNRTDSNDSRFFGTVPLQDVVGKARQIWFSAEGNTIRWERIGTALH